MEHTLEVRWFSPGAPPASVVDWITGLGAEEESARTDLYLVSTDPAMNVKLRDGMIQTKRRLAEPAPIAFRDDVRGLKERWVKWSFATRNRPDLLANDSTGLWHPVHKERLQREVPPDEQAALLEGVQAASAANAVLECTFVQSGGTKAWTVCMEAEGEPGALASTLATMGRSLFAQRRPPALESSASFGYAQWLARHVHD